MNLDVLRARVASAMHLLMLAAAGVGSMSCSTRADDPVRDLLRIEQEWGQASLKNDAELVGRYLDDEWIVIDPEGGVTNKTAYLEWIKSGQVRMETLNLIEQPRVRVYGEAAVVSSRAESSGRFKDSPFTADERATDVFVKRAGEWRCVLTQIASVAPKRAEPTAK